MAHDGGMRVVASGAGAVAVRWRADGARGRRLAGAALALVVHAGGLAGWYALPGRRGDVLQVLEVELVAAPDEGARGEAPRREVSGEPEAAGPAVPVGVAPAGAAGVAAGGAPDGGAPVVGAPVVGAPRAVRRPVVAPATAPAGRAVVKPALPGVAAPGEAAAGPAVSQGALVAAYQAALSAHLERYRRYPPGARQRREQGVATVRFTVDRGGRVVALAIAGASGFAALDDEALATLRRAEPLPGIPAEVTAGELEFVVPLRFQMQ